MKLRQIISKEMPETNPLVHSVANCILQGIQDGSSTESLLHLVRRLFLLVQDCSLCGGEGVAIYVSTSQDSKIPLQLYGVCSECGFGRLVLDYWSGLDTLRSLQTPDVKLRRYINEAHSTRNFGAGQPTS